ncbi:MAG: LacI family DNA-binding transcriptional regulator [Aerococcaceae bacterium]|nr:LacI family DNA-binding transcriptional regulator [Aerococcaceae bacterium]
MVTIKDIARMAGVSKSTVSRYLNGGSISKHTAEKINDLIAQTGYVPNTFAQSLKAKESRMIGAVIPRLDSASAVSVLSGAESILRQNGYQLMIVNTDFDKEREKEALHSFQVRKMDGVIYLMAHQDADIIDAIQSLKIPLVTVGQAKAHTHAIDYNERHAGKQIADYLYKMGHRSLDFINVSEEDNAVGVSRRNAIKEHFLAHPNTTWREYVADFTLESGYRVTKAAILPNGPSLIVGATDRITMGAMRAALEAGLQVPQEVSFAGFGNHALAESVYPGLTTVAYPYMDAGKLAAEVLLAQIQGETDAVAHQLDVDLVVRQSVFQKS